MSILAQIPFINSFGGGLAAGSTAVTTGSLELTDLTEDVATLLVPVGEAITEFNGRKGADFLDALTRGQKGKLVKLLREDQNPNLTQIRDRLASFQFGSSRERGLQELRRFLNVRSSVGGVVRLEKPLRNEDDYSRDSVPAKTAISLIERFLSDIQTSRFLVFAEPFAGQPSKVRSHKGLLKQHPELERLPSFEYEHPLEDGKSRFFAVIQLGDFRFLASSEHLLLNWVDAFIFLSQNLTVEGTMELLKSGLRNDDRFPIPYDFDLLEKALPENRDLMIFRYFPADNGKDERLLLTGHDSAICQGKDSK